MISVLLNKGKEKAVLHQHPWVFSGALQALKTKPQNGELVKVLSQKEEFLAYGYFNDASRVAIRLLSFKEEEIPDENWWRERIKKAVNARTPILNDHNNTCRLIFSESDFLPGLIVDKYGDYLAVQILTTGVEQMKSVILDELQKLTGTKGIFDKGDDKARAHDGLAASEGLLWGELPPDFVQVIENGIKYHINIVEGQKSGFYCDQRENRKILAGFVKGKSVLDCFSYSGGFGLNALANDAKELVAVDSSALAMETLRKNVALNGFDPFKIAPIQNDVNKQLRLFKEENQKFDIVILDPPKYAPSRSALDRAARAYKDLNRLGMQVLESGGLLATFSCSGAVDMETFKQIIAWAALDAGKEVQIIHQFNQPADHPIRSSFPEGEYLKGLLCRVY
ncbi:class I SAM-dependent rRNA methyltransferase [Pedobacter sp. SD-b]|uniref:Class I SAM-dependent rRNA methyltransferase n=1 Tax=Pedobacter segetis TaxID=2793069 RepID=A0ABS1BF20_9SPHI|nr:class I SAM-dependent rRNA methyltransferase [Pedobacter segetis]MBK0381472.1 class I SAM-dependent rRNA methyltransferase [Pedobacter segetis]